MSRYSNIFNVKYSMREYQPFCKPTDVMLSESNSGLQQSFKFLIPNPTFISEEPTHFIPVQNIRMRLKVSTKCIALWVDLIDG